VVLLKVVAVIVMMLLLLALATLRQILTTRLAGLAPWVELA
jgi:hypothetical protein